MEEGLCPGTFGHGDQRCRGISLQNIFVKKSFKTDEISSGIDRVLQSGGLLARGTRRIILCFSDIFLFNYVTIVKTRLKGDRIMKREA